MKDHWHWCTCSEPSPGFAAAPSTAFRNGKCTSLCWSSVLQCARRHISKGVSTPAERQAWIHRSGAVLPGALCAHPAQTQTQAPMLGSGKPTELMRWHPRQCSSALSAQEGHPAPMQSCRGVSQPMARLADGTPSAGTCLDGDSRRNITRAAAQIPHHEGSVPGACMHHTELYTPGDALTKSFDHTQAGPDSACTFVSRPMRLQMI